MDLYYLLNSNNRKSSSKKKKPKAKKDNWYERLTVDEIKQICRAAKLPVTGAKKVLIERLIENESTNDYAWEGPVIGCNLAILKSRCQQRNLLLSGTKFSLVLKIVQHDHGSAPEATAAATKRPAPQNVDGAGAPAKKRKQATPDLGKIYEKVNKKIESCRQKKYQSHYGSKDHAPEVYSCIQDIIDNECFEKKYVESDPLFALEIAKSALVSLKDNFDKIQRPGYDENYIEMFCERLDTILIAAKPFMDEEKKNATLKWIEELHSKLEPYGLGLNYGTLKEGEDKSYLKNVMKVLKVAELPAANVENATDADADADEKKASSEATQKGTGEDKVDPSQDGNEFIFLSI